jgi:multiple sugar transport system substrate-binding protein
VIENGGAPRLVLELAMASIQACRVVVVTAGLLLGVAAAAPPPRPEASRRWSLGQAAAPYRGVTVRASFLPRPGYEAAIALLPEFEKLTGIRVEWESIYYEKMRAALVSDFTSAAPRFDVVLVDVVWIGEFVSAGWLTPLQSFTGDPAVADPALDLDDFFPILRDALATWDGKLYGLPFDCYSGLLFYNRCLLRKAGFSRPPETWQELKDVYGPALTRGETFAYALQSHAGETQSCDSFMRFVWPFGGSLLTPDFQPNLSSKGALAGLRFRQELLRYMPPDVADWEHEDAVKALADGRVAMITEWSGWYKWLMDPASSRVGPCLGVALEPAGPAGRRPALGGFALGVSAKSPPARRAAAWLLVQWLTSRAKAPDYVRRGGVPGRRSAYRDPALRGTHPHFEPLAASWERYGNPLFRPRFEEWHAISRIISDEGTRMMRGQVPVQEGLQTIDAQLRYILFESGYYRDKKRLQ